MLKYKLGDTSEILKPAVFNPNAENSFREFIESTLKGELPESVREEKEYLVLTTQEQVDNYNNHK